MNAPQILLYLLALGLDGSQWSEPACDSRVEIRVEGDLYHRDDCRATAVVDFGRLLGPRRVLAAESLVLSDPAGHRVAIAPAEDSRVQNASGNPLLRLSWHCGRLDRFELRVWHLYFRTIAAGQPGAWRRLDRTFDRDAPGLVYATSFEQPESGRAQQPQGLSPAGRDPRGEKSDRSWAEGVAHTGRRSLKIARILTGTPPPNSNRPHWRTWPPPAVEVRPGETYRLTGWLKCARIKDDAGASVSLIFLDGEKRRLLEPRVRFESSRREHDWTQLGASSTAPPGAQYVEISFNVHGEGEVYLDDLELSLVAGSRIPDPAVEVGPLQHRPGP